MHSGINGQFKLAKKIAKAASSFGGKVYIVGGFARDLALRKALGIRQRRAKDLDLEVFGVREAHLKVLLKKFGRVSAVGKSFAVYKLNQTIDVSLPREDFKTGPGHRGFKVKLSPNLSLKAAARRRDFTINAIYYDPLLNQFIDPYLGIKHLRQGRLAAVNLKTFGQDPLRPLRGMQLAARFGLIRVDAKTASVCKKIDYKYLSKERIFEEWKKLLLLGPMPSLGLEAGLEMGLLKSLYPELLALREVKQSRLWHPEGDVWTHTKNALDAAAAIIRREKLEETPALAVMFAVLCHDLGKPATTIINPASGKISSRGHAEAGEALSRKFLHSLGVGKGRGGHKFLARAAPLLVRYHLEPAQHFDMRDSKIIALADKLHPANICQLGLVAEADQRGKGRPKLKPKKVFAFLARAKKLGVLQGKLKPAVQGRDLKKFGVKPGRGMGEILRELFIRQKRGEFETLVQGLRLAKKIYTAGRL